MSFKQQEWWIHSTLSTLQTGWQWWWWCWWWWWWWGWGWWGWWRWWSHGIHPFSTHLQQTSKPWQATQDPARQNSGQPSPLAATSALRQLGLPPGLTQALKIINGAIKSESSNGNTTGRPAQPPGTQCHHVGQLQLGWNACRGCRWPKVTTNIHGRQILHSTYTTYLNQHARSMAPLQHTDRHSTKPQQNKAHHSQYSTTAAITSLPHWPPRASAVHHTIGLHPWDLYYHKHGPRSTTKGARETRYSQSSSQTHPILSGWWWIILKISAGGLYPIIFQQLVGYTRVISCFALCNLLCHYGCVYIYIYM